MKNILNPIDGEDVGPILLNLRKRLLDMTPKDGDFRTPFPALTIHRRSHPTDTIPCIYELGIALTISGCKQVMAGKQIFEYGAGQALLVSVDLPVVSQVLEANEREPYMGLMFRLDPAMVMKVSTQLDLPQKPNLKNQIALAHGDVDARLLRAVFRLIALFDEPALSPVLAPLIQQEVIARLLVSEHGPNFMQLNASSSPSRQIAKTIAWMKLNFAKPIQIESLADQAHMSPTTFRQHFKNVAGISPLQYVKQIRLQEARQIMFNEGLDASTSGLRVGYESVSQFTREYARLFGEPPSRDIKKLRNFTYDTQEPHP